MSLQYLVSAVSSFIIATVIEIRHRELIPVGWVNVFEGSTVMSAYGSLQPVTWTYTIDVNEEFDYDFDSVEGWDRLRAILGIVRND